MSFFPIRCFTCGKPINNKYRIYEERTKNEDPVDVLQDIGIKLECCQRMFLSHTSIEDDLLLYDTPGMENFAKSEWKVEHT